MSDSDPQRIDRWLWHARLFRSRSLTTAAVKGGHVEVNGSRAKPSRLVAPGDTLTRFKRASEYGGNGPGASVS